MKKILALVLSFAMLFSVLSVPALADEKEITVIYNGEELEFDVPPMLINSRTMVPMRAIFEALQATVYWSEFNETVVAVSTYGDRITIPIGSTTVSINDLPYDIDSPAVLVNDRTLVPLRFVSEALDCKVEWDDATYTVNISSENNGTQLIYIDNTSYSTLGTWTDVGSHIIRAKIDSVPAESPRDDAVASFRVGETGTYKLWAKAIDYATNQQGTRFFNIDINGNRLEKTFGQHGMDDFQWEDGGTIELTKGEVNELRVCDTAGFFGRLKGIIITNDLEFVPTGEYADYEEYVLANLKAGSQIPSNFPEWANQNVSDTPVETIENDSYKINFYTGATQKGNVVQNEILIKRNGEWTVVKERSEDLGILALHANESKVNDDRPPTFSVNDVPFEAFTQKFDTFEGEYDATSIRQFYKTGKAEWLIPDSLKKIDDKTVELKVSSEKVEGTMTFTFDDLVEDPKVTFNAKLKNDGAYSFAYFTGNDFDADSFEKVTAPIHFIQKEIPNDAKVVGETSMFTPMIAFTFDNNGQAFTKGVAVDPTSVRQYAPRPGDQDFGMIFRSPDGKARGQIIAPLFGTEHCTFKAGDNYTFAYRILYKDMGGYETMEHVASDMFNCTDIRENYYASLNEAIYNTTDLIKDDLYSGWHEDEKAFIYMESDGLTREVSNTNFTALLQRYLLTEDEEFLDERVIPLMSFILSRGGNSYDSSRDNPRRLGGTANYSASSYLAMYQGTQGRMPLLYNEALNRYETFKANHGSQNGQAFNQLTGTDNYTADIIEIADTYLEKLYSEEYVANTSFIHDGNIKTLNILVRAYEETNDKRYLDGAELVGEYLMQQLWTTGYHNDYATTDYTVDPEYTSNLILKNDFDTLAFWWFGFSRWRIGNPPGVHTPAKDCENKIEEETAPGWVPARVALGTEHPATPGGAKLYYANMWAGTMLRLAKYTDNEFFRTQARNTIIGRFANYPGYYNERLLLHDKQADFPYVGPDYNFIFWHHIPAFLAMIEDFLISDAWDRSDMNIDFPSVLTSSYAFFESNQFGYAPGKFYDEEDMWLWLDRGIVEPDSVLVNYVPAKKDGILAVALMNTDDEELTTTITLGEKIPNASTFNETATLLDKDGNKSDVEIKDGKFTVTIPAKGIASVIMHPEVTKPSWVQEFTPSAELGDTVSNFDSGQAMILQLNADNYYAFLYSNKFKTEVKSISYTYSIDGKTKTITDTEYPYEIIVKVPATCKEFKYEVMGVGIDGKKLEMGSGVLKPVF